MTSLREENLTGVPLEGPPRSSQGAPRPGRGTATWTAVLRRGVVTLVTLFVISIVIFAATQVLPGDAATHALGRNATPETLARVRADLHLDEPLVTQYWMWMQGMVTGDLGMSISARVPVSELIGSRIVNTFVLVMLAAAITLPLSILFGVVGAIKRDRMLDQTLAAYAIVFTAVPDFAVGMILLILFATTAFTILPGASLIPAGENPLNYMSELVLPVLTLVLVSVPYLGRLLRASMIDVLQSEYVVWARLKGASERRVILRHALPNALVPMIQGTALILAYMSGGIVVLEYLFGFPGLGSSLLAAVHARDVPVIQAVSLIFAAFYVLINILADLLSVLVTPQLRRRVS